MEAFRDSLLKLTWSDESQFNDLSLIEKSLDSDLNHIIVFPDNSNSNQNIDTMRRNFTGRSSASFVPTSERSSVPVPSTQPREIDNFTDSNNNYVIRNTNTNTTYNPGYSSIDNLSDTFVIDGWDELSIIDKDGDRADLLKLINNLSDRVSQLERERELDMNIMHMLRKKIERETAARAQAEADLITSEEVRELKSTIDELLSKIGDE